MAITTDSTFKVSSGGVDYDTVGLSKTLDNYTVEEISEFTFCGAYDDKVKFLVKGLGSGNDTTMIGFTADYGAIPMGAVFVGGDYSQPEFSPGDTGAYNLDQGKLDYKVIWLQANSYDYVITENNYDNYKALTEFDINKYTVNISAISDGGTSGTMYFPDMSKLELYYTSDRGSLSSVDILVDAQPYIMFQKDTEFFIVHLFLFSQYTISKYTHINNSNAASNMTVFEDFSDTYKYGGGIAFSELYSDWAMENPVGLPHKISVTTNFIYVAETDTEGILATAEYGADNGLECRYGYSDTALMRQIFANAGLYFKHDSNYYKPVISGGWVLSYTDDLNTPSEIDGWERTAQHTVTPTPPAPPYSDEDDTSVIPTVGAPFATGLAHYYITTADSVILSHISEAMGAWDIENTRKDLYRNLISCKLIKPPTAVPSASGTFEIYGVKPQYNGADITISVVTGNPSISFGAYSIPRKFNDFRDYAPYSKAEIFLPYCGWTALPSHVIGRTVSVTYYTDIIAATCKAVVYCGANVVAEAAGVIGLDIPFAADNVGAKMQAVNTGLLAYGKAALETAIGVGTSVATKGKSGIKNIVSGASGLASAYSQTAMAFNENWTEINGKNGDGCSIAGISSIVIKITRPKYGANSAAPFVPSGYAHATGFISQKKVTVGSVSGLLVCENPDVSGIAGATDAERAEIRAVLESGLIVNSPPE